MALRLVFGSGRERLKPTVTLQKRVFLNDPVLRYLLHGMGDEARERMLPQLIEALLTAGSLNDAIIDEAWAEDQPEEKEVPQSSMMWLLPGRKVDTPKTWWPSGLVKTCVKMGPRSLHRLLSVSSWSDAVKKKALGKQRFLYLFWIGTDASARGTGIGSSLILHLQEQASKDKMPIYLESSSAASRRLYTRLGFKDTESRLLGKGEVDAKGDPSKDGPGVMIWGMVWWPEVQREPEQEGKLEQPEQHSTAIEVA